MSVTQTVEALRGELAELEARRGALALDLSQAEGEQIADEVGAQIAALQEQLTLAAAMAAREKAAKRAELQSVVDEKRRALDAATEDLQKARSAVAAAETRLKNAQTKLATARQQRSAARSVLEQAERELAKVVR